MLQDAEKRHGQALDAFFHQRPADGRRSVAVGIGFDHGDALLAGCPLARHREVLAEGGQMDMRDATSSQHEWLPVKAPRSQARGTPA